MVSAKLNTFCKVFQQNVLSGGSASALGCGSLGHRKSRPILPWTGAYIIEMRPDKKTCNFLELRRIGVRDTVKTRTSKQLRNICSGVVWYQRLRRPRFLHKKQRVNRPLVLTGAHRVSQRTSRRSGQCRPQRQADKDKPL